MKRELKENQNQASSAAYFLCTLIRSQLYSLPYFGNLISAVNKIFSLIFFIVRTLSLNRLNSASETNIDDVRGSVKRVKFLEIKQEILNFFILVIFSWVQNHIKTICRGLN